MGNAIKSKQIKLGNKPICTYDRKLAFVLTNDERFQCAIHTARLIYKTNPNDWILHNLACDIVDIFDIKLTWIESIKRYIKKSELKYPKFNSVVTFEQDLITGRGKVSEETFPDTRKEDLEKSRSIIKIFQSHLTKNAVFEIDKEDEALLDKADQGYSYEEIDKLGLEYGNIENLRQRVSRAKKKRNMTKM